MKPEVTRHQEVDVWPWPRVQPFDPPPALAARQRYEPTGRVTLWDASTPWLFTRYDDIRRLLGDHRVSSDPSRIGFPEPNARVLLQRASQRSIVRLDPPRHDEMRRMLASSFRVQQIATHRPFIAESVQSLLTQMRSRGGPLDLVENFASRIPAIVTCRLLGLPEDDASLLHRLVKGSTSMTPSVEEAQQAADSALDYFDDLIARKENAPADDLISTLITERLHTGELSRLELQHMLHLLLIGGFDTTASMLALSTAVLLNHPNQLDQLKTNVDLWPQAIEELLRYLAVAHQVAFRIATEDIEIGKTLVRAGEGLVCPVNIANRDPAAFSNPDSFDIAREARGHLTFGFGIHQCLGQHLARLELQVALPALFRFFPRLRLERPLDEMRFNESVVYGLEALPVNWK